MAVTNQSGSRPACILFVEDEVLVRMFAVDSLEDAGFRVEQAGSAGEAMARLQALQHEVTAIVIDLGLPDRPGDEVATEMRGILTDVPILIASGRSERELRQRFSLDKHVAIMVKPYTGPMLIDALASLGVVAGDQTV
ncbi:MAG TPA: response regulator [Steroidobacteraceae bacterium]|jgi:CheY-like chemotaxis protein